VEISELFTKQHVDLVSWTARFRGLFRWECGRTGGLGDGGTGGTGR
jgi:hypothetical protein